MDCYIEYVCSQEKKKDLCYLTGNIEGIWYLHPKKIRNEGDGAKLISSNASQNFTYRGRFINKEEAFAVGNETSQKIHNALKWIIRKQERFLIRWQLLHGNQSSCMPRWNVDTEMITSEYAWDDEEPEEENHIRWKCSHS